MCDVAAFDSYCCFLPFSCWQVAASCWAASSGVSLPPITIVAVGITIAPTAPAHAASMSVVFGTLVSMS